MKYSLKIKRSMVKIKLVCLSFRVGLDDASGVSYLHRGGDPAVEASSCHCVACFSWILEAMLSKSFLGDGPKRPSVSSPTKRKLLRCL